MAVKILFVEGESETPNGDLRQGLSKLLGQRLKGKMPKIILGGGKTKVIQKFKNNQFATDRAVLLLDLDAPETDRARDLEEHDLETHQDDVFYMIQEMEAWFFSQPKILDEFYKQAISSKLKSKPYYQITKPSEELRRLTKGSQKGEYHKIKHGLELLKLLDAQQLEQDSPDFQRLILALH